MISLRIRSYAGLMLVLFASVASSQSNGEWQIAGLRLGMTPEEVQSILASKYSIKRIGDGFVPVKGLSHNYLFRRNAVAKTGVTNEEMSFTVFYLNIEDYVEHLRAMPQPQGSRREREKQEMALFGSTLFASEIHFSHHSGGKFGFNPKEFIRSRFGDFGEMGAGAKREVFGTPDFRGHPTQMTVKFGYRSGAEGSADSTIGSYVIEYKWTGMDSHIVKLEQAEDRYREEMRLERESKIKSADEPF